MSMFKRAFAIIAAMAVLTLGCIALAGCGEPVAATYDGGKISEEDVTTTIENMRTAYGLSDEEEWQEFLTTRAYDTSETASLTAVEKAASQAPNAVSATEDKGPGSVEDLRAYVIEQIIRSELIQREIKNRNVQVSDEEVEMYIDQQRTYVESMIMEGVFESIIQRQGYRDMDAYRDAIREQLKQLRLQTEVSELANDNGQEVSGKAAWFVWFNKLYEDAHVKINPALEGLVYNYIEVADEGEGEEEGME